jgi:hypothetical protein
VKTLSLKTTREDPLIKTTSEDPLLKTISEDPLSIQVNKIFRFSNYVPFFISNMTLK